MPRILKGHDMDRRTFLRSSVVVGGGALAAGRLSNFFAPQAAHAATIADQMRSAGPTTPVKVTRLRDTVYLLQGVGGNMVATTGPDGQLLIDSSVSTAAPRLKEALDGLGSQPLKILINTHWHFDHTDGNAALHDRGALIIAHENTRVRLSSPQRVDALGMDFPAAPTSALPQTVFADKSQIFFNQDELHLAHFQPAHTDSDVYVFLKTANVLHAGDTWFNGFYPLIDYSSGGRIDGMVRASGELLALADDDTKIVPGHGPLGTKADLKEYHDMLVTVRDRVQGLKQSGRSLQEAVAAKPTAELDKKWGGGMLGPDIFVTLVYKTLPEGRA
jgi:glyoxylase-like metal-dependent hydrolase (beta-lactamase superfamily II)